VVTFPGSNGDHDAYWAFQHVLGVDACLIDYRSTHLSDVDALVLPGGFSYGDYLRCGAIARFAPVMDAIARFADSGGPILGICNGFQILTEAHLLPGALVRNQTLRFHAHWAHIKIEPGTRSWVRSLGDGAPLRLPVAHGDGAYTIGDSELESIERRGQVVARYCTPDGDVSDAANTNGSVGNIAGVSNQKGNVVGLMPHPERAVERLVGGTDGLQLLGGLLSSIGAEIAPPAALSSRSSN
jgi:phosphoribosylformylglycinamidine synthase